MYFVIGVRVNTIQQRGEGTEESLHAFAHNSRLRDDPWKIVVMERMADFDEWMRGIMHEFVAIGRDICTGKT